MDPNQNFLHSKGNHKQDEKTPLRMGENSCKWSNWQRINHQNIQASCATQHQKQTTQSKNWHLSRHLFKEDIEMAKRHMKRCSTSLTIKDTQIKTTMRYHLPPVKMAIIKMSTNSKCWREYGEEWINKWFSSVQSLSHIRLFATPWNASCLPVHHQLRVYSNSCPLNQWCHPTISSSVVPFSSCLQLSRHQGLSQWVSSLHQVAKVLQFQLQYQSFQWMFSTELL